MTQHSLTSWASSLSVFDIHLHIFCIISKNYYYYYKTVFLHFSFCFLCVKNSNLLFIFLILLTNLCGYGYQTFLCVYF